MKSTPHHRRYSPPISASVSAAESVLSQGALSLLQNCVGARAGQRLLLVHESEFAPYYDRYAPAMTAAAARALGLSVYEFEVAEAINDAADMEFLLASLHGFDHVVFFARVGDQVRFTLSDQLPPSTMCYTLSGEDLNSAFGTACHRGLCDIKAEVDQLFQSARHIEVSCPLGTRLGATFEHSGEVAAEVSIKRFPMLVPRPVPMQEFSGQVVLSRFLVGTGSRFYDPYLLPLDSSVIARVEGNRITGFDGENSVVEAVNQHYRHVAGLFDLDALFTHSWHAGIHPACEFHNEAVGDIQRWCGSAFGSPRILHFHTCGNYAPGEISWNVLDPTIVVDGQSVWQRGQFMVNALPGGQRIRAEHPQLVELFDAPKKPIGIE